LQLDRVDLTPKECRWFSKNVLRMHQILEERAKQDPKVKDRRTYKVIDGLRQRALDIDEILDGAEVEEINSGTKEEFIVELYMDYKERRELRTLLKETSQFLRAAKAMPEAVAEIEHMFRKFK